MLDIQSGVELDPERVLYDDTTVALLKGLDEACLVAGDKPVYVQSHRFRGPDGEEEAKDVDEEVKEDKDPRAAAFISVVGRKMAIQTVVGATVLSVRNLGVDLTRIESEDPHTGTPLPIVHNEVVPPSHTLTLELFRDVDDDVNGIILTMHYLVEGLIGPNATNVSSLHVNNTFDEAGKAGVEAQLMESPGGSEEGPVPIANGKQILQNVIARMTVMFRLIAGGDVRLLTGGEEVKGVVEEMVQGCLREAGV